MAETVTVLIENSYECGRSSNAAVELALPAEGQDLDEWFQDEVYEHTGDGHSCGSRENAIFAAKVVAAPAQLELVGETYEWG